ncbi:hypothetical protein SBRY_21111 [Actinacidiphila bryophytorum]|uniref:Uncharacterized protein n=1 Tax=Actinacidiphila bryophytorum TaxID=1436133 RepID=A0A9W4E8I1_9ACTN|nr:hypothetical protein SBRY_21111 [Actinacidiphila bryophytorum]
MALYPISSLDKFIEKAHSFGRVGVSHGHPYDIFPLVVMGIFHHQIKIAFLYSGLRSQVVLKRPMNKIRNTICRFSKKATSEE